MGEDRPVDVGASVRPPLGSVDGSDVPVGPVSRLAPLDGAAAEFAVFYTGFMPRLVRFLVLDGAPPAVAAELAQEVMVALWRSWDGVQSRWAWTRTTASRAWIRYRTRVPELPTDIRTSALISIEAAADIEVRHDLLRLLARLTPREQQVMARTYDGDTPAEIAAELHITEATVRTLQRNARRRMAEYRDGRREGADQ